MLPSKAIRSTITGCCLLTATSVMAAPPTTFGTQVGHALLCMDQLNSNFFYDYVKTFFGPPYKKEDGAYWFRAGNDTYLWGTKVTEILVGDLTSEVEFIAAVFATTPETLSTNVTKNMGIRYQALDYTQYPVRESKLGSRIIYANQQSKMYCAKSKQLLNPSDIPMSLLPHPNVLLQER